MAVRFRVAYQGTRYHGFQRQSGSVPTVQGVLEAVLTELLGPGRVRAASRTDAGVHAQGQVAVWTGENPIPLDRFADVINRRLPGDIWIDRPQPVDPRWNPRRQAVAKAYSYRLWVSPEPCPVTWRPFVWVVEGRPNWAVLEAAARAFEGEHDFWAFRSEGSSAKTTVRRVLVSRWEREADGAIWRYRVVANGFLYHMVRKMVGAQVRAALAGDWTPIRTALADPRAGKMRELAPAEGLVLDWVRMRGEPEDAQDLDLGVGR
ncbi:MAG: tRNA pseudouridine synthase A [Firmicutes bacterium]|nr:tRNA pseudouridine synthase A [Alicyclobacillaceae bacterium]MCL6497993.1 tRNA pseudouridine synthase A [Bacillota bacterium]